MTSPSPDTRIAENVLACVVAQLRTELAENLADKEWYFEDNSLAVVDRGILCQALAALDSIPERIARAVEAERVCGKSSTSNEVANLPHEKQSAFVQGALWAGADLAPHQLQGIAAVRYPANDVAGACSEECECDEETGECKHAGPVESYSPECTCQRDRVKIGKRTYTYVTPDPDCPACELEPAIRARGVK